MKYRIIEFITQSKEAIFAISPDSMVEINRERFLALNISVINILLDAFGSVEEACGHIGKILADKNLLGFDISTGDKVGVIGFAKTLTNYMFEDQTEKPTEAAASIPYDRLYDGMAGNHDCEYSDEFGFSSPCNPNPSAPPTEQVRLGQEQHEQDDQVFSNL